MNPIQTNKPVFFGNNGEVLKNGYIYIGQPNQDPVPTANRKTVTFQDTSGTQFTAQQPLRTGVDGRIVYQATGKPIIALVDGNYSMLIQDENQVIIKNGYTPFISNTTTSAGSDTVIYRSTLVDLKTYNGTPGDYVENVGEVTATDGDGARWLVVSNTGSPGDDVDLIDFDNGTQGVRVFNQLYTDRLLGEIEDAGASAQIEARGHLGQSTTDNIADDAVTTPKIADDAVTNPKVPDGALGSEKFQSGADERDWVLERNASASAESVGTYAFLKVETGVLTPPNATRSGSDLRWANANGGSLGTPPAGVWRCMGYVPASPATNADATTLFLRIS